MHRRCIICGQDPGDQCVYPHNMAEARRWQNLANLSSFDVDTESLCQHGCVCSSHLDMVQEYSSDPGSTPEAASAARSSGGKLSMQSQDTADERPSVKWSSSGTGQRQPGGSPDHRLCGCYYPTNNKAIAEMQSKQSLDSRPQGRSDVNRGNIGLYRCRGAMPQGNPGSQMRQNIADQQPPPRLPYSTAPKGNFKANQPIVIERCTCLNCPLLRKSKAVPEECTCPLLRNSRGTPEGCPCGNGPLLGNSSATPESCPCGNCPLLRKAHSPQRKPRNAQVQGKTNHSQQNQISSNRLKQQKYQGDDEFLSLASTATCQRPQRFASSSSSRTTLNHQKGKPSVKCQSCQASINALLRDKEVQCSTQPRASSTARGSGFFSQRTAGSVTEYGSCRAEGSKGPSSIGNINTSNFGFGGEQQQYSNAVNVLLMNGSRQNNYGDPSCCCPATFRRATPPPEICVQESDLADCNERAVFPEIDKPKYRAVRAATSDPNAKGKQAEENEANVLVLEEGPIDGCNPEEGVAQTEGQVLEGTKLNQNKTKLQKFVASLTGQSTTSTVQQSEPGPLAVSWVNEPAAANYTKVLELQRVRINELENLLQQHNQLQQTIQARIAELQNTGKPVPKG